MFVTAWHGFHKYAQVITFYEIYFIKHYYLLFKVDNFHYEPESAYSYYCGCIGLVHYCYTVVVFAAPGDGGGSGGVDVEMVLPNLSWSQRGYGNIAVTYRSTCGCGGMCCGRDSRGGGGIMVLIVICLEWR